MSQQLNKSLSFEEEKPVPVKEEVKPINLVD
jgi:hypothetical protein